MKTKFWLSLGLLVCASSPCPNAAQRFSRWRLAIPDANPPHDDRQRLTPNWRPLRVPANWYSAGVDHRGALWYRTTFTLPRLAHDRLATLTFDGVDYRTEAGSISVLSGGIRAIFSVSSSTSRRRLSAKTTCW